MPRGARRSYTHTTQAEILRMRQLKREGHNVREISELVGRSKATVSRHTSDIQPSPMQPSPYITNDSLSADSAQNVTAGNLETHSTPGPVPPRVRVFTRSPLVRVVAGGRASQRAQPSEIHIFLHVKQESLNTQWQKSGDGQADDSERGLAERLKKEYFKIGLGQGGKAETDASSQMWLSGFLSGQSFTSSMLVKPEEPGPKVDLTLVREVLQAQRLQQEQEKREMMMAVIKAFETATHAIQMMQKGPTMNPLQVPKVLNPAGFVPMRAFPSEEGTPSQSATPTTNQ